MQTIRGGEVLGRCWRACVGGLPEGATLAPWRWTQAGFWRWRNIGIKELP